ncbi:zinc ribbon domain-containing protein [Acidianus brierleyi]|uniref:Zinc ribbon domain-containing protein n=1 Tax=Acidianus brierleyi TaxID=41673 RepID=A0A2U9IDL8_9CREN|nr:zinc ribbon domain-containing protein [Acidianus brierleyi]AWR94138.1 zinc-ribbon domain-containing protein [Acidianus brierleyi]
MGYQPPPYNPYGQPYGAPQQPYGQPYGPYGNNPMMTTMMCEQSTGLGGKTQMVPINYPINLQYVSQQITMYLMSQGFQAFPMVGQNMAVIQAKHDSVLGMITDKNKAYTIRLCQAQNMVVVETGIANLMEDLLVAGATAGGSYLIGDDMLHSKLLEILGGGATAYDAYNIYKDFAQEDQLMNMIVMAIMSAPPAGPMGPQPYPQYGQQYGYQQPYGQPYAGNPQPYGAPQQYGPYPPQSQPSQYPQPPSQQSVQQSVPQPQNQSQTKAPVVKKIKCWKCGTENDEDAKFCSSCGASLQPVKCPKCGTINQPGSKFCSNCGSKLVPIVQSDS